MIRTAQNAIEESHELDEIVVGQTIPGNPTNWPPSVSQCPIIQGSRSKLISPRGTNTAQTNRYVVNMLQRVGHSSNCPILMSLVHGHLTRTIFDTGSDVTVAPESIVRQWMTNVEEATGEVVGLGNTTIAIKGQTKRRINVLGDGVDATILVLKDTPGAFEGFDMIIGNDTMATIGKVSFDFKNFVVSFSAAALEHEPSTSSGNNEKPEFESVYGDWLFELLTAAEEPKVKEHYKVAASYEDLSIFMGVSNYYKTKIPNFEHIVAPLQKMINDCQKYRPGDKAKISWNKHHQKAYDTILSMLRHLFAKAREEQAAAAGPSVLRLARRDSEKKTKSAIIPVKVNGLNFKSLVDTGATLSIAPMSMAQKLGCALKPCELRAISASGHLIKLEATSTVNLQLGDITLKGPIHFVNDENGQENTGYDLLLGCDLFANLPPITFDFANAVLTIGRCSIPMENVERQLHDNLAVRAMESIVLAPGTHEVIQAKVEVFGKAKPLLVEQLSARLEERDLGLIPAIVKPKNYQLKLIISNPINEIQTIHKGTKIAVAKELNETSHEHILTELAEYEMCVLRDTNKIKADPEYKIDFSKSNVTGEKLEKLKKLCEEYEDVFSKSQYDLGSCTAGEHDIVTTTDEPVASKPRPTPYKYREELNKHLEQLLASGVMIESDTPWVSNIVLVQKKDGGLRPCIDFRKLNEVTIPDHYPLPRLSTIMEKVGNCCYYTSLDLSSGYLQLKLSKEASRKCGVISENKVYQMLNLPFGLRNATSAFARCMAHVLSGLEDSVVAYVDDILIFTKEDDFDAHLASLRNVFERFRRFCLKLSPKKCIFAAANMNFLGFVINSEGYTPSLSKVETIKNLPRPTNVRGVRHVVGMASFFRKHVPNFSTIVEPLTRLTKKEKAFVWEEEQEQAFAKVKQILSEKPVLVFPDYSKPFHIFTDASLVGQGGALMQKDEEKNVFNAIAYCSRTLPTSERKWPAVQVELGAIIFALREFKPYIFMSEVELHCDHKPLAYLMKKAEAHHHLARWLVELQSYNIKIVHIAGKQNLLADALSRLPHENVPEKELDNLDELEDIAEFPICLSLNLKPRVVHSNSLLALTLRDNAGNAFLIDIIKEQKDDGKCHALMEFINSGKFPAGTSEEEKDSLAIQAEHLCINGGILYFHYPNAVPRIFVPISLRAMIFEAFHNSPIGGGHMNLKKTLKKCKKYFWPRMHADIVTWTKQCITCQLRHSPNPAYRAEMQMPPANTLFGKVGLDLAGPFPTTQKGNKHILNIICCFTKYVISVPVPDAKATTLATAFFRNCYLKYGGCTELLSDNAAAFSSDFFRSFCAMLYINKSYATPHWSQGNAVTERSFRTFHNILAKYITRDEPDFDEYLDCANFCYNTSVHTSTNESPFFLMFGRDPIFCVDQILDPKIRQPLGLTEEGEFKAKLVNSLRNAWEAAAAANQEAQVGDRVLLRNYTGKVGTSKKFHLPWKGIFRVIKIDGVLVTITSCTSPQSNPRIVHINQLKKCIEARGPVCTIPELPEEEKEALKEAEATELEGAISARQNNDQMDAPTFIWLALFAFIISIFQLGYWLAQIRMNRHLDEAISSRLRERGNEPRANLNEWKMEVPTTNSHMQNNKNAKSNNTQQLGSFPD